MSDEKLVEGREKRKFDVDIAHKQSRELVADLLMMEAQPIVDENGNEVLDENGNPRFQENKLFLVAPPQMNDDGSMILISAKNPDDEVVIVTTVLSGYMKAEELFSPTIEQESGLVGLDGQKLSSDNASKIITL